ncbi:cell division protein ZipA [Candidatus Nitrosoglobus terrae]|uniref:Cell division protein ZipA n=1 Tax=Candidatus Nitrosoglobus terrae TaxID=1630141 RepID=A0A1Q2SMI5_9GAMM|nr:cell division protein ZipA [Candidatus Nitrosoglobus terrae]BAW80323.1 cell division protein ZipA [Candidatus Nitrosoglobus terrae]
MDSLRLALLVVGVLIFIAIYFYSQWEAKRKGIRDQELERRRKQTLDAYDKDLISSKKPDPVNEEVAKETTVLLESGLRATPQHIEEAQGLRMQEEPLSANLGDFSVLLEEAEKRQSEKKPEQHYSESLSVDESEKNHFVRPKKWFKTKPKPDVPAPPKESSGSNLIIALTVIARGKGVFRGREVVQILEDKGLQFGEMDIFHAYSSGGRPIFSVANIVEPGSFNLGQIDQFSTPGLALFLCLPGPAGGFAAFDGMLEVARLLAGKLSGDIRDDRRNVLTTQAIQQIRERILTFNRACRSLGG